MSIASKLKALAISMGCTFTSNDDSIEEILAKMKGHTGGSSLIISVPDSSTAPPRPLINIDDNSPITPSILIDAIRENANIIFIDGSADSENYTMYGFQSFIHTGSVDEGTFDLYLSSGTSSIHARALGINEDFKTVLSGGTPIGPST